MPREISSRYHDPLDVIWLEAARQCEITVVRSPNVFAAWDGQCELQIGVRESLDPDDSLAQMILHELCHALVAGPDGQSQPDWGLDYDKPEHMVFEHAALRIQAALADEFGLREFLASTTDFRDYFDQLPANALECQTGQTDDPAIEIARKALERSDKGWGAVIRQALKRTRAVADLIADIAPNDSLWKTAIGQA